MSSRSMRPAFAMRRLQRSLLSQQHRSAQTSSRQQETFDIICVGGGPAGYSLINSIRASSITKDLKVALVDSQDLSKAKQWRSSIGRDQGRPNYSNRCSSLTPSSKQFLNDIGVWNHIEGSRVQPYQRMQVWDGISGSHISFDGSSAPAPFDQPGTDGAIAYMVENNNLVCGLANRCEELGGVSIYDKARVDDIVLGENDQDLDMRSWPIVKLENGTRLAARLLIGADGMNSPVRSFSGIKTRGWDYDRHGVVATLELEHRDHLLDQRIAYQRFLPSGPVALLPLPGPFATLVWSTTPEHASLLKSLPTDDFLAMVNAAFRLSTADLDYMHTISKGQVDEFQWRLPKTDVKKDLVPRKVVDVQAGTIASFPLRMRHADTYTGERVALIGDAAHTIHPLAGQGLNQGQGDAQALLETIQDAVMHGQDIGSTMSLEPYNTKRYATNNAMLGVVDKLHKLYSVSSGPLVAARSLGLSAVNALEPLKSFFIARASGR